MSFPEILDMVIYVCLGTLWEQNKIDNFTPSEN